MAPKGQIGFMTPVVWVFPTVPNLSVRGTKRAMTHKRADWLHDPCRPPSQIGYIHCAVWGVPYAFTAGDKITIGPQVGRLAAQPLLAGGSPTLYSRGGKKQRPTTGQIGYVTPAFWGVPYVSKQGRKSAMARKCADWLHDPFRLGGAQCFKAGDKITTGPRVGRLAT